MSEMIKMILPRKMTLQEVGEKANDYYKTHRSHVASINSLVRLANNVEKWFPTTEDQEEALGDASRSIAWDKRAYDENIEDSAKFAKDNAENLHDLAVIEAHLGGVAINVEQPVEVGQKIEVHKA